MWKLLVNFAFVIQASANPAVIREVGLKCDISSAKESVYQDFVCHLTGVSSSTEQVKIISINVNFSNLKSSPQTTIDVSINGNLNYPEYFPKNLSKSISGTVLFQYSNTSLKYIQREDLKDIGIELVNFSLDSNKIEEIPFDTFYDFPKLLVLELCYNNLKSLPPKLLANSPALASFSIENNKITELHPDMFQNCPKLDGLYATSNNIENLHENLFKNNPKLRFIEMRNNNIKSIGIDFTKIKELGIAIFTQNVGICNVMYLSFQPHVDYYENDEQEIVSKTLPEFQERIEKICRN